MLCLTYKENEELGENQDQFQTAMYELSCYSSLLLFYGGASLHACVYTCLWRPEDDLPQVPFALGFFETGSLLGSGLDSARLADQGSLGTYLSSHPLLWDHKHTPPRKTYFMCIGMTGSNSGLIHKCKLFIN